MMEIMYYLGFLSVFCLLHLGSAAPLPEDDPVYGELVSLAEKEVANGHPYVVNEVYSQEAEGQENLFVVSLEVQSNPSKLCTVTIDASSPDSYSVIDKACQNEETIIPEDSSVPCAGCLEEGDISDPLAIKAAEEALNHYNNLLGEEMAHANHVEIVSVKSQVVSGVRHVLTLDFITEDGESLNRCISEVWSQSWLNFTEVISMDCIFETPRETEQAVLEENDPIYGELVSFAEKEVANGHSYVVNGVYRKGEEGQENVYVVRLEVQSNPSMLCTVTIDVSSPDSYSVIGKACQNEVNEETIIPEDPSVPCAGCLEEGDISDPLAIKAAEEALNHYNNLLGDEMAHAHHVEIINVKSQVVSGVKHFLTLDFIAEDGETLERCMSEVWSQPWLNFTEVISMDCDFETPRETEEAALEENDPIHGELVSFTEKEVANGHPYVVNGVYNKEEEGQENVFVVRLEVQSNPSMLCTVTIDASSPDSFSVIEKVCQNEVNEETIIPEDPTVSCRGCVIEGDVTAPLVIKAAEEALNHYNNLLGDEMGHADRVEIISVKSQVVNGVKHYLTLNFITENGELVKRCEAEVRSQPWLKLREVLSIDCNPETTGEAEESA